ncbi:MAG: peptidase-C39 like family protein [Gemmatimonadota bacterium]
MKSAAVKDERAREWSRVAHELDVERIVQPDEVTCGPTCLRKVFAYFGRPLPLPEVLATLERNEDGGTLAVFLGIAALKQGFGARIYSYDLRIFDPTWFGLDAAALNEKIFERFPYLAEEKRLRAAGAYIRFLEMGGELAFDELTPALIRTILDRDHPVLAGLSATYLYRFPRERWDAELRRHVDDDVRGEPTGHFVVISGYDHWGRKLSVVDPSEHVPVSHKGRISVDSERLINAILLGDVTYDAGLLEVWPKQAM